MHNLNSQRSVIEAEETAFLDWLSPLHRLSLSKRSDVKGKPAIQTRCYEALQISDDFQTWLRAGQGNFWCIGGPGVGKTFLATMVLESFEVDRNDDQGLAYLFCQYENEEAFTHVNILGSIVLQLIEQQNKPGPELLADCQRKWRSREPVSEEECIALINILISRFSSVCIVLDAFDECPMLSRGLLFETLAKFESKVRIFATTRFKDIECRQNSDIDVHIKANELDVQAYVLARLRNPKLGQLNIFKSVPNIKDRSVLESEVKKQVSRQAAGQ